MVAVDRQGGRDPGEGEAPGPIALGWWPAAAAVPTVSGALWLWWATQGGLFGALLGGLPGPMLLATGLSNLLWAGDPRLFQFMALGALSGVALALPSAFVFGPVAGALLLAGSALSFAAAGYLGVGQEPVPPGVPEPRVGAGLAVRAAGDEASMCAIVLTTWPLSVGPRAARIRRELDEALGLFADRGWLEEPRSYHRTPPPVERPGSSVLGYQEKKYEQIRFESGYEPWPGEPGRERWLSYERNRTAYAWVLRHPGERRPWLVCVHGIRVGSLWQEISLFHPEYLHEELGLNLLFPVLPIHGPRRVGPVSGDRIMAGDVMDTLHAASQTMWDVRRLLLWLRMAEQDAPAVGALGHSLGGYAAALVSCLDDGLDCVVVGNPAVDPSRLFWRNALSLATRYLKAEGVSEEAMGELLRVISPLALAPRVPKERRAIFGGSADRVTPPVEASSLWHHWGRPRIAWYQGTHRGFLGAPEGRTVLEETLRAASILPESRRSDAGG